MRAPKEKKALSLKIRAYFARIFVSAIETEFGGGLFS